MKSMIAGFLTTALLLALHVAPPAEALQGYASPADKAFAERHRNESKEALQAELGLQTLQDGQAGPTPHSPLARPIPGRRDA